MHIADNLLTQQLRNVYWILGKSCGGKTTAAKFLAKKYGMYHYEGDEMRSKHFASADASQQPALCRDVPDMLALSVAEIRRWECDIIADMTPMILLDMIRLSGSNEMIVFDGDISLDTLLPLVNPRRVVYLSTDDETIRRDFFRRPDHRHMVESVEAMDLSRHEKDERIGKLYEIVSEKDQPLFPKALDGRGILMLVRDDASTVETSIAAVEGHFGL